MSQRKVGRVIATVPEEHGWEGPPSGLRFNDGKASPGGAFIVGRMNMDWRNGAPGRLYRQTLSSCAQAQKHCKSNRIPCSQSDELYIPNLMILSGLMVARHLINLSQAKSRISEKSTHQQLHRTDERFLPGKNQQEHAMSI